MEDNELNIDLYKEITIEEEVESSASELMSEPFKPSEISIKREFPTISNLVDMMKQSPSEIDLNTEFQRSGDLWGQEKQSRLIESILVNFPLPAFYFDAESENKWLVVDGLQRLSCLNNFIVKDLNKNKYSLRLKGLEFLKHLEGKKYSELDRPLQRAIDQTQVTAYIINPGTPQKVKYNIFKRINTGGLVLEPQEIRHALFQGAPANFISELASLRSFKKATENKIPSKRMLDREFTNRFTAFYLTAPADYTPDLESFLNSSMEKLNTLPVEKLIKIKNDFDNSMHTAHSIFGNWAFRKADLYPDRRKPINKSVFEIWAVELAKLTRKEQHRLIIRKKFVLQSFAKLCRTDQTFINSISEATGDKSRTIYRFKKVEELIKDVLNAE